MAEAFIIKPFEVVLDCAVKPVERNLSYAFRCKIKISKLEKMLERLVDQKHSLQHEIDEATRQGNQIESFASIWLTQVEETVGKGQELLKQARSSLNNECCGGINPKKRWKLGWQAAMKSQEITELLEQKSGFPQVWFRDPPQQLLEPALELDKPSSRIRLLQDVKGSLQNPNVRIIGCYGMGGSGKSTLAKELKREAASEKLFENIIFHEVTSKPDIRKIQGVIADFLGVKLEEESEPGRAARLHEILTKKTKLLIILDDLWEVLDLTTIGIPNSVKLFLTSRNKEVLDNMNSSLNFRVEDLPTNEAMDLFESSVKKVEYPELAKKILQKCYGHPLTIVVVAGMLRGKHEHVWQDTLKQLEGFHNQQISSKVYSTLELSYHSLVDKEQKEFFLLCGILGESKIAILDLLKYCVGLRLFEQIDKMKDAWNRLLKLVDDLVSCGLLAYFQGSQSVQIHDLLRDTAALIASRTRKTFMIERGRKLDKWPSIKNETTRISMPFVAIDESPPSILECPDLEFFLYQAASTEIEFSDSFFERCIEIRVVTLSRITIKSYLLLSGLANLRTLCLQYCNLRGNDLKDLAGLKKLEVLSFRGSFGLESIPKEIGQLINLKFLDLRYCYHLEVIPAGLLSKFSKLEELYMANTNKFYWDRNENASLSELESMQYLTSLEMKISDANKLPEKIGYNELQRYSIYHEHLLERCIYKCQLKLKTNATLGRGSNALLRTVEFLHFKMIVGTRNAVFDLEAKGFPKLRALQIDDASELECFIDSTCSDYLTFPNLETLTLHKLTNLGSICNCHPTQGSFEGLRHLSISDCHKLQYAFSVSMVERLSRLQLLQVKNSNIMEGIFHCNERDGNAFVKLPKLIYLALCSLAQYSCFIQYRNFSQELVVTKVLFNDKVSLPQLELLNIRDLPLLEVLWEGQPTPGSFYKLNKITLYRCNKLKVLFNDKVSLPQLKVLHVEDLPLLEVLWEGQPTPCSFYKLNNITLYGCDKLKVLFNDKVSLPQLEVLHVRDLPLLEVLWDSQLAPSSFDKLNKITLHNCKKLKVLFSDKVSLPQLEVLVFRSSLLEALWEGQPAPGSFDKLNNIHFSWCNQVKVLFSDKVSLPQLEVLQVDDLPLLDVLWEGQQAPNSFDKLNYIRLLRCNNLKVLFSNKVSLPQLEQLQVCDLPLLETLWDSRPAPGSFSKLKVITLSSCKELKVLFSDKVSLPQLEQLDVSYLPLLEALWEGQPAPHSFDELLRLRILYCDNIKSVFRTRVLLPQLEFLCLHHLPMMEALWPNQGVRGVNPILQSLKIQKVNCCPRFKKFSLLDGDDDDDEDGSR